MEIRGKRRLISHRIAFYHFSYFLLSLTQPQLVQKTAHGDKQLTRQNDDLRETKERLRAELEGMNKQMDRKQKLLSGEFEVEHCH